MNRPSIVHLIAAVLLLVPAGVVGAQTSECHIADPAGDANVGLASGDTRPASYDPADILCIRFETEYVAVPIGDDGIHHRPTGLVTRFSTLAPPRTDGPTLSWQLGATIGGCQGWLFVARRGQLPLPGDAEDGTLFWSQTGAECPDGQGVWVSNPSWTAEPDEKDAGWTWRIPFDSLTPQQADALAPGRAIASPQATTWAWLLVTVSTSNFVLWRIDHTAVGPSFVIGSDVPPDVPCTRNCPEEVEVA